MATSFERVRSRLDPNKRSGSRTIGRIYPWNTNIKNWHPTPNMVVSHNFNLPNIGGQITGDEKHPGPPYLTGGPFKSLRYLRVLPYMEQGISTYTRTSDAQANQWQKYVGGFHPPGEVDFASGIDMSNANTVLNLDSTHFPDLAAFGVQAWSKTKPLLQRANAFVFLAELRDAKRMISGLKERALDFHLRWKSAGGSMSGIEMSPKHVASNFLNNEFGWRPFLSDLRKFYALYHGSDTVMKRITATNGKSTRRRATIVGIPYEVVGADGVKRIKYHPLRSDVKLASGSGQLVGPNLHSNFYYMNPSWEVWQSEEIAVTSSGKFTFYRPEFDSGLNDYSSPWFEVNRWLTVYGARVTPSNIYRATPWTWLIDWFTNIGEHFDLLTDVAQDSVTCQYLYLNERRIRRWTFKQMLPFANTPGLTTLEWQRELWTQERLGTSSPYGFSLSWDSLTPRQLLILGALGITRGQKPAGGN